MRDRVKQLVRIVPPDRRRALGAVLALAAASSAMEAIGTALVFLVLQMVNGGPDAYVVPVVGDLHDRFPDRTETQLLAAAIGIAAAFFALRAVVAMTSIYAQNRVIHRIGEAISAQLVRIQLRRPYTEFLRRSSNEAIRDVLEAVDDTVAYVLAPVVAIFTESVVIVAVAAVLVSRAPGEALLLALFLGPALAVVLWVVQPRVARLGVVYQGAADRALGVAQQLGEGMRDIRILGREEFFARRFDAARAEQIRAQYIVRSFVDLPRLLIESLLVMSILGLLGFQLARSGGTRDSVATLGLFGYAAIRILPSLNRVTSNLNLLRFGGAASARLDQALAEAPAGDDRGPASPLVLSSGVRFQQVEFRYDESGPPIVRDIDLDIPPGQAVGLVGRTAAGKSTLVDLFLGLITPTSGTISIDGIDLRDVRREWQASIGLVSQAVFLFNDSVAANIALGEDPDDWDMARIEQAATTAQLDRDLEAMDDGLATLVGERGNRLSGGQRQRVAIARALYRQPAVLVFDEGTSALDARTEAAVMSALRSRRPSQTTLVVAHRIATVRDADVILVMEGGRIVDRGSYDELRERSLLFRQLADT